MAGKGVVIQIQGDGESAKAALDMVKQHLHETAVAAEHESEAIVEAMETVKVALETVGLYLGLREGIDLIKEMVGASIELGVELGHVAKETGISAENVSLLKYASDQTGVSFEALTKGSVKLSKTMLDAEEGKKQAINSFARLGISQEDVRAKSHDLYGMLGLIADRFDKLPDGPQKAAAAVGIFGKAGAALIPFLDQGAKGIEELRGQAQSLGIVLTEDGIEKMEELHKSMARVKGATEGMSLSLTETLEPAIETISVGLVALIGELKQVVGLQEQVKGANMDKRAEAFKAIPDKIVGMSPAEQASLSKASGQRAEAAEAEIRQLEGMHDQKHIAEAEYNRKRAAAQKEADEARLVEAQAGVAALEDISQKAHQKLADTQKNQKWYQGDYETGVYQQQEALKGLDAQVTNAYSKLIDLQKKTKEPTGEIKLQDQSGKVKAPKSDDSILRAGTALAEAQANAAADAIKSANSRIIAEQAAGHKAQLVSDADFYQIQLLLEKDSLDARIDAAAAKMKELEAQRNKEHGDKLLKRNPQGFSEAELATSTKLVEQARTMNELREQRAALDPAYTAGIQERAQVAELANLRRAADLEKEKEVSITAQVALLQREAEIQSTKVRNSGGSDDQVAVVAANERMQEQKLALGAATRVVTDIEADYGRRIEANNDAAAKNPLLKNQAAQANNELRKQEAADLQQAAQLIDALSEKMGGPATEAAQKLHAELDKLNRPDQKEEAAFTKTLIEGLEHVSGKMAETSGNFHQMVKSMEKDFLALGVKLVEQQWITPLLQRGLAGGAALPTASARPDSPGGAGGALTAISQITGIGLGGNGKGNGVVLNIVNQTSAPITGAQTGGGSGGSLDDMVVHIVLKNASEGGPLARLLGGG